MTENDTAPSQPNTASIDDIAPDFIARSTQGEVKLSDYRGRWLLFFSHPADFTPVLHLGIRGAAEG